MTDKVKVMTDLTGRMSTEDLDDSQSNNPMADEPHKPKRPFSADSKNWIAQSGLGEVDDMEIINSLNLDPNLAYTNPINRAALQAAHKLSYQGYLEQGYDQKDARDLSNKDHAQARQQILNAEKLSGKKFL